MSPIAAIFDLDGTLITFNFNAKGTKRALLAELDALGVDSAGLDEASPTQRILDRALEAPATRTSPESYMAVRRRLFDVIDRFEVETIRATSIFPGTKETLAVLRDKGVYLALLTNSGRRATDYILGELSIAGMFQFVLTRDDVDSMKPSPEGLKKALGLLPPGIEVAYYVGDSPYDIDAAKKAGMKVISVPTGNYTAAVLRSEGADFVVDSLSMVPKVLGL